MALEPRILYDGAAAATAHDHHAAAADSSGAGASAAASPIAPAAPAGGHPNSSASQSSTPQSASPPAGGVAEPFVEAIGTGRTAHEIVIIDANVPDLHDLVAGVKPGDQVYLLDSSRDGLQQIADIIEANDLHDLSAIHIVSHGGEGQIHLGSTVLTDANLASNAQLLAEIGASLGANGDILLYGCDVGAGAAGQQFIADLAARTGADVAASTDRIGSAALGGDWTLETATGAIEASLPFSEAALENYDGVLAPTLTATQTMVSWDDTDGDGVVDPGEIVTTEVVITNTSGDVAGDVTFLEALNGMTEGSVNVSPLAFDDNYSAVGNTLLIVGNASGSGPSAHVDESVIDNDTEFLGDSFTISAFDALSANGGTVSLVTSGVDAGSFSYVSAAGFTGSDTFTYTLRDAGLDGIAGNTDDLTGVGTVTITVSNRVWYVDSAAGTTGDGRSTSPFDSLADVTGALGLDAANDIIYVHERTGDYDGNMTLLAGQQFIGSGVDLVVGGFTLQTASTATTLTTTGASTHAITLDAGNTVRGFAIGNTTGAGIFGSNVGALTINNVSDTGTGKIIDITGTAGNNVAVTLDTATTTGSSTEAIKLTGINGSFTASAGSISGVSGTDVLISGGNATVNIAASITSSAGGSIEIANRSSGGITLSGALNITGGTGISVHDNSGGTIAFTSSTEVINTGASAAVSLVNNAGATINFTNGGLDIDTTAGAGFLATGGGTVTVQGAGNSITTGTGTALSILNTTIGAADLTFRDISANGALNGIVLTSTGALGGLLVTGNGASTAAGTRGTLGGSLSSGGTIRNTTGDAIVLNGVAGGVTLRSMIIGDSTATATQDKDATANVAGEGIDITNSDNIVLENVHIARTGGHGISGVGVTNFSMANTSILNAGNANDEDGLHFSSLGSNNLDGTAAIVDSVISGSTENNAYISNLSGTLNLTVSNTHFTRTANTASLANGEEGLKLETQGSGTANITANVTGSQFDLLESDGITVAANAGTVVLNASGNTFTGVNSGPAQSDNALSLGSTGSAILKYRIDNNILNSSFNSAIILNNNDNAQVDGIITNNVITGTTNGFGIDGTLAADDNSTARIQVSDNQISGHKFGGLRLNANNTATLHATVTNNTIGAATGDGAIFQENLAVEAAAGPGAAQHVFAKVEGNTVGLSGNTTLGFGRPEAIAVSNFVGAAAVVQLERGGSASSNALTVLDFNNPDAVAGTQNGTGVIINNVTTDVTVVSNGTVQLPSVPAPLLVAPGGVAPTPEPLPSGGGDGNSDQSGGTDPLQSAGGTPDQAGSPAASVDDGILTAAELDAIVDAAIARWAATGLTADQIAYLQNVTVTLADMPGWELGSALPGEISIDRDAGGHGWFIDLTPLDDAEFANNMGGRLLTNPDQAPAGHVDLLTTVMHELGHELGLADTYSLSARASLMYGFIVDGERRLPVAGQADGAVLGSIGSEAFIIESLSIGTLPAGKSVTIQWRATVDLQSNGLIVNPSNQGTVEWTDPLNPGGPVLTTLTDDPGVVGAANPTVTVLDTLTLGSHVFHDADGDGFFDVGESGIGGVVLNLYADTGATPGSFDGPGPGADAFITSVTTSTLPGQVGTYSFAGLAPGNYIVQVDAGNFIGAGALVTYTNTSPDADPNPNNNEDNDNNGGPLTGGFVVTAPIALAYDAETTDDGTGELDINNTLDIGFIINNPPVVDLNGPGAGTGHSATFTEDLAPVAIAGANVSVSDPNNSTLAAATITITNFVAGQDVLAFTANANTGDIVAGAFSGGVLQLTSAGGADFAAWQAALQAVTYANTSQGPDTTPRTIEVVLDDGQSGNNLSTAAIATVQVVSVNDAPDGADDTVTTPEDTPYEFSVADFGFSDVDGNSLLEVVITTVPTTGTLRNDGTVLGDGAVVSGADIALGNLTFTPVADASASPYASFTFQVRDNGGIANGGVNLDPTPNTITIDVTPVNDPAVITGTSTGTVIEAGGVANGTPGTPSATGDLDAADIDNLPDTFQAVAAPAASVSGYGTYTVTADGVWTYTLDNDNAAVQALNVGGTLSDTFTVLSADGTAQLVTITINGANDAATITGAASGDVTEDGPLVETGDLDATDDDNAPDTFQPVVVATATTYGSYTLTAGGVWTYTLDNGNAAVQALNAGGTLSDTFTALSEDGTSQLVTITIHGQNDPAVITGTSTGTVIEAGGVANGTPGTPSATGDLDATDIDNPPDTFQAVTVPAASVSGYGTYTMTADGVWTYTLDNDNAAVQALNVGGTLSDTFTVLSADGTAQLVTITINGANDAATITGAASGDVTEDGPLVETGDLDAADDDNAADTFQPVAVATATTYGSYTLAAGGVWTYTLDNGNAAVQALNAGGTLSDTFTALSEDGTSQLVTITIHGQNDPAVITGTSTGTVIEAGGVANGTPGTPSATGDLDAADIDNPPDAFQAVAAPAASVSGYGTYTVTADGVWTYTLDNDNAAVQALNVGGMLNDTFTVLSADGTAQLVTITINGANDAATITGAASGDVTEDGPLVETGDLDVTDDDNAPDTFQPAAVATATTYGSYTLTAGGVWTYTLDNGNAAVQALNAGGTLSDTFTALSEDGTSQLVTITIHGQNDPAVITGTSTGTVIEAGGVANGTPGTPSATGDLDAADIDSPPDTFQAVAAPAASVSGYGTYTVTADGVWTYTLDNDNAAVQALNVGGTLSDTFTVLSADGTAQLVTITINGANDAATIAGASTGAVVEAGGVANGTPSATGDLGATDIDNPPDAFQAVAAPAASVSGYGTYTVTADGVWTYTLDNGNAAVQALNAGGTLSDTFTVLSADGTAQLVTITINGANDTATITGASTGAVVEAGGVGNGVPGTPSASGDLLATDVDNSNDAFQAVTSPSAGANGYGTYTVTAAGVWTYTLNNSHAAVQALNAGGTLTDTFTVVSADGTAQVVTVTINGANDSPVLASNNFIFYDAERRQDKVLNPNITISDVDSATLSGARIAITAGLTSDDRLRFTNQNGITGSYNSATGVLTLTGVASVADYQAALRSVTFFTDTRRDGIRFVTWTVNDGAAANNLSAARSTTILVDGINIRPPHHGDHHHHHHHHGHHGHHDFGFGNRLVTAVGDAGFSFENRGRAVHYVHSEIEAISVADALQLKVPFDSLVAPLGGDVVSVTATLLDGSPLPPWLTFDAKTGLLAGSLPAGVLASIRDVPGEAPGDVTGSLSADPRAILGTQPATRNGPINIEVVMRDTRGNISVMVFSIDLKVAPAINPVSHDGRQSWYLPLDDRPALHEMPWAAVPGAVSDTLAGDDLAVDDAPIGRAGLSAQLATHGWRGMDAERAALLGSLQETAGWR